MKKSLETASLILLIVLLVMGAYGIAKIPNVPTADEIASKIQIPAPTVSIPDVEVPDIDYTKINQVWDKVYGNEIAEFEDEAIQVTSEEITKSKIEDFLEDNIDNFEALKKWEIDSDETEVTILNLGLDDEDDRGAIVTTEIDVRYTLSEGQTTSYKDTIYVSSVVTSDDGELEAEVSFSF